MHAGVTQARAIVRHKAGKAVEFGLPYLLSRLGGGYIFGTLIRGVVDESKMPLQALAGYRAIFGAHATPTLLVYDRGGYATATLKVLLCPAGALIGISAGSARHPSGTRTVALAFRAEADPLLTTICTAARSNACDFFTASVVRLVVTGVGGP